MPEKTWNVLFLCTGNSARSILAEAVVDSLGKGRFKGYSAGSHPKGEVHPLALELLREKGFSVETMRSKDWGEFAEAGAPQMDFVFTVCDNAAGEACPVWPGKPITAHWGIPDPAAVEGTPEEKRKAFFHAYNALTGRIALLVALPIAQLDNLALEQRLKDIGRLVAKPL